MPTSARVSEMRATEFLVRNNLGSEQKGAAFFKDTWQISTFFAKDTEKDSLFPAKNTEKEFSFLLKIPGWFLHFAKSSRYFEASCFLSSWGFEASCFLSSRCFGASCSLSSRCFGASCFLSSRALSISCVFLTFILDSAPPFAQFFVYSICFSPFHMSRLIVLPEKCYYFHMPGFF